MPSGFVQSNKVKLWYDRIGNAHHPTFLLISGAHGKAMAWNICFCEMLAERGFQVVRFDIRDTGWSERMPRTGSFGATDVADDAIGLLDALGISSAHVAGISAGSVFAQYVAIRYPDRVLSLVSMMGTSGDIFHDSMIKPPSIKLEATTDDLTAATREQKIQESVSSFKALTGPRYPLNEEFIREYATAMLDRDGNAGDAPRLLDAIVQSLPVPAEQITAPTLIIHGTADPLMSYSAGLSSVRKIPGSRLLTIEGMGHDLISPRAFPYLAEVFSSHALMAPPLWVRKGLTGPPLESGSL